MGLRFRRSVKLAPGIRMNFSGSGVSWTLGPRGASVGIGKRGTYLNSGIPGTGLYARERLGSSGAGSRARTSSYSNMSVTIGVTDDGTVYLTGKDGSAEKAKIMVEEITHEYFAHDASRKAKDRHVRKRGFNDGEQERRAKR